MTGDHRRAIVQTLSAREARVAGEESSRAGCGAVGSAPALGAGGPQFESAHPDRGELRKQARKSISGSNSVVEFLPSKQAVAGSSPVSRSNHTGSQFLSAFTGSEQC